MARTSASRGLDKLNLPCLSQIPVLWQEQVREGKGGRRFSSSHQPPDLINRSSCPLAYPMPRITRPRSSDGSPAVQFLSRIGGSATKLKSEKKPKEYTKLYREVFQGEPDPPQGFIHFPFPWGSPEAAELQSTIWKIESQMWRQFLASIRDEKVAGDLVEFGVSVGNSLEELIGYCEDLDLKMNISQATVRSRPGTALSKTLSIARA
jgi:hypothetical protein